MRKSRAGKNNPAYKHGKSMIPNYCIICNKQIGWRSTRCMSCAAKERVKDPTKHPNYRHGKLIDNKYCPICKKKMSREATTCRPCAIKIQFSNPLTVPSWNGGRRKNNGYILIYIKDKKQQELENKKYIFEHRLKMEQFLNRKLNKEEIVHHINGIRTDNRIENLMLFSSNSEHRKFHGFLLKFLNKFYPNIVLQYVNNWNKTKGVEYE